MLLNQTNVLALIQKVSYTSYVKIVDVSITAITKAILKPMQFERKVIIQITKKSKSLS
jgi:hypothetical protein